MRVPSDTICKFCDAVFCCAECRHKHEKINHAIVIREPIIIPTENHKSNSNENLNSVTELHTTYLFCPICEKQPLVMKPDLHKEMLLHLELHHLPLRCQKCFKVYNKINDFKEFSKCICQNQVSLNSSQSCYTDDASKVTVTKAAMPNCVITESSPLVCTDFNESHMTPISIINMRWKAKSKLTQEEFISDSMSSIKNISSINNSSIRRNVGMSSAVKGKVIRCSSTPVQLEMVPSRPKEQTFNATGGQMSSIQYNSGCESDTSPAFSQSNSSHAIEPVNRYIKITGSRPRMTAVTPLRQVMSKSIRKALAEHGFPESNTVKNSYIYQRKNMFDTTSSPQETPSPLKSALDLRLSPAIRRSQSEGKESLRSTISNNQHRECNELSNIRREVLLSAQKLTTESIVITHTEHMSSVSSSTSAISSNYSMNSFKPYPGSINSSYQSAASNTTVSSVYKSRSSVEILTATTEEIQQFQSFEVDNDNIKNAVNPPPLTPKTRISGSAMNKKVIKFETPKPELCTSSDSQSSPLEAFFTPNASPPRNNSERESSEIAQAKLLAKQNLNGRFSPLRRPSIRECAYSTAFSRIENSNDFVDLHENAAEDDEVFLSQAPEKLPQKQNGDIKDNKTQQRSGLWSLMASVMRLPSFKGTKSKETCKNEPYSAVDNNSNFLIKRCASIAGSLVRSKSLVDESELSSLKRKRTLTLDNQSGSAYLVALSNTGATSPTSDFNTSSKRVRIQGRRPINRMRLNS